MSKFIIERYNSLAGKKNWWILEKEKDLYLYKDGGLKKYDGLAGLCFDSREKAREALNKYLSPFKIGENVLGWYVEQVGTNNYLHTDGEVRDWYVNQQTNVYFKSKQEAEAALDKFIGKPKPKAKPKLSPSAKFKVDQIVVQIKADLTKLTAALKELTGGK